MAEIDYDQLATQHGGKAMAAPAASTPKFQDDPYDFVAKKMGGMLGGDIQVAAPPSAAELRSQKYGTASPEELKAKHQANYEYENPNLLQAASRIAEGGTQGIGNFVKGIAGLGKQIYDVAKAPAASMQNFTNTQNPGPMARLGNTLSGMGPADAIAGLGYQAGKYIYDTPEAAGEVIGENAAAAVAPELVKTAAKPLVGAVEVARSFTPSARAATFSERATNQLVAGLQPKTLKVPKALKSSAADLHNYIETTGKGKMWKNSREFDKISNAAADDFYKKNYQPMADDIAKVDPTIVADLERRSEINKTLGRLGYFDKSPMVRAMAKTSPQVGALVEELDGLKSSLNTRFDALAPTNTGAGKILRRFSDLKEVADRATTQADRIELAKMIQAGEEDTAMESLMGWARDAGVTAATLGAKPALFSRWWNILKNEAKAGIPLAERDQLFARAAENWQKGSRAFKGAHQPIVRTGVPLNRQLTAGTDTSGPMATNPMAVANSQYAQKALPPASGSEVIPSSGQTIGEVRWVPARQLSNVAPGQNVPFQPGLQFPQGGINQQYPAPVIEPVPTPAPISGGSLAPPAGVENSLRQAQTRMAQEAAGQSVLDNLEAAGRTPQHVVQDFWTNTYNKLPSSGRQLIEQYLNKVTGFKPGDVIGVAKDGSSIVANSWQDIYSAAQAAPEIRHLEGTERGLISLMEMANEQAAKLPGTPQIGQVPTGQLGAATTGYPANTNPITGAIAGSTETPAQRAQSLFEAQTQIQTPPPITVPEVPTNKLSPLEERRTMNRIQSGYTGKERRAPEIPAKELERIENYKRRQKAIAIQRKQYEKTPR